jgi:hypothetical protein
LNAAYPGRTIGRRGQIPLPPLPPDPTPMFFFLLELLKEHFYAVVVRTIKNLVTGLKAALTTVDTNMRRRVPENT